MCSKGCDNQLKRLKFLMKFSVRRQILQTFGLLELIVVCNTQLLNSRKQISINVKCLSNPILLTTNLKLLRLFDWILLVTVAVNVWIFPLLQLKFLSPLRHYSFQLIFTIYWSRLNLQQTSKRQLHWNILISARENVKTKLLSNMHHAYAKWSHSLNYTKTEF